MAERRLTIFILGLVVIAATIGTIVLAAMSKPVPITLITIGTTALGVLAPSPLSKTAVPDK